MAQQQILVSIAANANQFSAGMSQAQKALANFNQGIIKSTSSTVRFRAANGQFIDTVGAARQVVAQLRAEKERMAQVDELLTKNLSEQDLALLRNSDAMKSSAHATGSASFALLSLGQAFQDSAQFGMGFAQGLRAVNNNIQQTFTAIALGATQAGGFGNLMRQMGSALWGPAGLIIGFSVVSAAAEFFATRAQKAAKESNKLADAWVELAKVVPTKDLGEFSVSQAELEKRLAAARVELERLSRQRELEKMSSGLGQMALAGNDAGERIDELRAEVDRLTGALDKVNKAGEDYVKWLSSVVGMQALANETAQDFARKIADLEADLAMSGEFSQYEQRVRDLQDAIASGLGFGEKDPEKVIADLNKRYRDFVDTLREMGSTASVSRSEFAEMLGEGGLGKFFAEEQWKRTVVHLDRIKKQSQEIAKAWEKILGVDGRMTVGDRATPLPRGEDGLIRGPENLAMPAAMTAFIEDHQRYIDAQGKVIDANQEFRESMASMGADFIASVATMGGGFDSMQRYFGSFLMRFGKEAIKMGLLTVLLGRAITSVRLALQNLQGPQAVVAGLALIAGGAAAVAAGSAIRAQGRSSASALSSGGTSGDLGIGPANGFVSRNPLLAGSTLPTMVPTPAQPIYVTGMFEMRGRDLVAVVEGETRAQQEMGVRTGLVLSR